MKRKVLIAAALIVAVAVLVVANLRNQPASGAATQGPKGAPEVRVQAVRRGSLRQEVIAPGDREWRVEAERERNGIPVDPETVAFLGL